MVGGDDRRPAARQTLRMQNIKACDQPRQGAGDEDEQGEPQPANGQ
jgi:hypothetical protein